MGIEYSFKNFAFKNNLIRIIITLFISVSVLISSCTKPGSKDLYEKAIKERKDGNLKQAVLDFTEYLRQDPKNCDAYFARGNCFLELRQNMGAIMDFNRSIELCGDATNVFFLQGNSLYATAGL